MVSDQVAGPGTVAALRMIISMGGLRISEVLHSQVSWYKRKWITLPETKNGREHILPLTAHGAEQLKTARALIMKDDLYLFPHHSEKGRPMLITSMSRTAQRIINRFDFEPFQLRDIRRTMKTHLLDGEYVEEREIDIWHNHGQNSDVARKHYSWAEYKALKVRVGTQIDVFLGRFLK